MDVCDLTRALIDIESITENEREIGEYLQHLLQDPVAEFDGCMEVMPVEPNRSNIFACWGQPVVTLSTHMDTVPPFLPSRDDGEQIWGRGACDTKGIIAAMIRAAEGLLREGVRGIGLLFVVGEERNSAGAFAAAKEPRGSRFLINGEPTESKLAIGSKGALRYELVAKGRMAHSAYPELGESAVNKLLDALQKLRALPLGSDPVLGESTLNIGTLRGGRAPNVIADDARAEVLIRLVDNGKSTERSVEAALNGLVEAQEVLCIPAQHLGSLPGFATTVVAYTTDIPAFGGAWGEPYLFGPGTIHVAHTDQERIRKDELRAAVGQYQGIVRQLLAA